MDAVELWWCAACQHYHVDEDVEARKEKGRFVVVCKETGAPVTIADTWSPPVDQPNAAMRETQAMNELANTHD